jgi:hypothetical protein
MSHFSKIETRLCDLVTIEKTLSDLNIPYETGDKKIRGYKDQDYLADIIIRQSNNYDIGFKWNNNQYELVTDLTFWAQAYSVDQFLNQVRQRYAFNLLTKVGEKQNFQFVETESLEDGSIKLVLRRF